MATVARPGTFERRRDAMGVTRVQIGERVQHPGALVEVGGQQRAGITAQQRVDADRRLTPQMRRENVVGELQVLRS